VAHLNPAAESTCRPQRKPPHIVMVFDESSFDATNLPGTRVAPDYRHHFASFDGKNRALVVEGAGGPSWFTEYNVLTGLSVRSYGRFATSVTRIAAAGWSAGCRFAAALRLQDLQLLLVFSGVSERATFPGNGGHREFL
jgi:hypothetical protein